MKPIKINVTDTAVTIKEKPEVITAGNVEYIDCEFELSEAFDGLVVRAAFNGEYVTLVSGRCKAPMLRQGLCKLAVYGYTVEEEKLKVVVSPEPAMFYVTDGSYNPDDRPADTAPVSELERHYAQIEELVQSGLMKGDKGDAFTYKDFTPEQLAALKGADGNDAEIRIDDSLKMTNGVIGIDFAETDAQTGDLIYTEANYAKAVDAKLLMTIHNALNLSIMNTRRAKQDAFHAEQGLAFYTDAFGRYCLGIANLNSFATVDDVNALKEIYDDDSIAQEFCYLFSHYTFTCTTQAVSTLYIDPAGMATDGASTVVFTTAASGTLNIFIDDTTYPLFWHGDMPTFENGKTYELNFTLHEIYDNDTQTSKTILIGAGGEITKVGADSE